jgi:hypothetical protein
VKKQPANAMAINKFLPLALIAVSISVFASAAVAQEKEWPESKIKIDPNDVRQQVIAKLNEKSKGAYTMTTEPPSGFPVPIYPGVENATYTARGQQVMSGTMKTSDPPATVINWYKQAISQRGFNTTEHAKSPAEESGRAGVITASKDDTTLTISTVAPSAKYSLINITSIKIPKTETSK